MNRMDRLARWASESSCREFDREGDVVARTYVLGRTSDATGIGVGNLTIAEQMAALLSWPCDAHTMILAFQLHPVEKETSSIATLVLDLRSGQHRSHVVRAWFTPDGHPTWEDVSDSVEMPGELIGRTWQAATTGLDYDGRRVERAILLDYLLHVTKQGAPMRLQRWPVGQLDRAARVWQQRQNLAS